MNTNANSYKSHRFPPENIAQAVWLYDRLPMSMWLVEEMLLERGMIVSYETIPRRGRKFGPSCAKQLRRKKPSHRDIWHLDEVVVSIGGRKHWLQRAVVQDGYVLDEIIQTRRNKNGRQTPSDQASQKQGIRAYDHRVGCNTSFPSSQPFEISSFRRTERNQLGNSHPSAQSPG